ncbi:unnamed protein product [Owenia fusiformis]|uniref:Uncharacterized protein n=1 Tax=Owenia fusiformis TaxID=6347 RepID=A0A8J1UU84_OWEFU|nr:unnamed protein product [Owenia fusiformis]
MNSPFKFVLTISLGICIWIGILGVSWIKSDSPHTIQQPKIKHTGKKPKCSLEFLKNYFLENGEFYARGVWSKQSWIAKDCVATLVDMPNMLFNNNLSNILLVGDSTATRYARAFVNAFKTTYKCRLEKKENAGYKEPDMRYFSNIPQEDMYFHTRECYGCDSFLYNCSNDSIGKSNVRHSGSHVTIEYVSMEYFMDTEITTLRFPHGKTKNKCRKTNQYAPCEQSPTSQEFIFNEYLQLKSHEAYPQLILLIANHHETRMRDAANFKRTFTWFLDVVNNSIKNHPETRVIWLEPTFVEESKQSNPDVKNRQFKNVELYNEAKKQLIPYFSEQYPRFWPFYGVMKISERVPGWNQDGIHFNMEYYESMISLLLQALQE